MSQKMAVFKRIPEPVLLQRFTHRGWFMGLVPIYLGEIETGCPVLAVRNWVPEVAFDLGSLLFELFCLAADVVIPGVEFEFPIKITGRLDGRPLLGAKGGQR